MASAGYSGTPLARKLGIKDNTRLVVLQPPAGYDMLLAPLPSGMVFEKRVAASTDIVHLFVDRQAELARQLATLRQQLRPDAALWISWPKKASKVPTDIGEDDIRTLALPLGFVDIKVCAVDAVWSGLKLVLRKELRGVEHSLPAACPRP
ncbi:MAG: DUF3052 domain-containing protein [Rubrivivax sp.]